MSFGGSLTRPFELSALDDVEVSPAVDGQTLTFVEAAGKWEGRANVPYDYVVTQDAAGNITATPRGELLPLVQDTDLAAVLNAVDAALAVSPAGFGSVFLTNSGSGVYIALGIIALTVTSLFGAGFWPGVSPTISFQNTAPIINGIYITGSVVLEGVHLTSGGAGVTNLIQVYVCSPRISRVRCDGLFYDLNSPAGFFCDIRAFTASLASAGATYVNVYANTTTIVNGGAKGLFLGVGGGLGITLTIGVAVAGCKIIVIPGTSVVDDNAAASNGITNDVSSGLLGILSPPAVTTNNTFNTYGTKVEVIIRISSTVTTVSKNAQALGAFGGLVGGIATPPSVTVTLNSGEYITLSQTTGVSWTWWAV